MAIPVTDLAVILARVSSTEQARGQSPDDQIAVGRQAINQNGWHHAHSTRTGQPMGEVHRGVKSDRRQSFQRKDPRNGTGVFLDLAVSGDSYGNALLALLDHAARHDFDIVVVWKLDRLARNLEHQLLICKVLVSAGVQLYSVTEGGFTDPKAITAKMQGMMSEDFLLKLKDNTKRGIDSAKEKGHRVGGTPVGLVLLPDKVTLAVTELGQQVEALAATGLGPFEVGKRLGLHYRKVQRVLRNVEAFKAGKLRTYEDQLKFFEASRAKTTAYKSESARRLKAREKAVSHSLIDAAE